MNAIVKLLDGISAGCFRTDAAGRVLYYPNGAVGSGYVVPDDAALASIKGKLRWYFAIIFLSIGLLVPFAMDLFRGMEVAPAIASASGTLVLLTVLASLGAYSLASGLEKSDEKLSVGEAFRTQARSLPRWFAIFQVVIWSLGMVGAAMLLRDAATTFESVHAVIVGLISAALLALSIWSLRLRPVA
ncbi:MAG: hypothetical protein ACT4N2_11950 [Hyphomicrobium sp.]